MNRSDYAFPFRLDGASRRGALASSYKAHVEQLIRQLLLTSPGERVNRPTFGCGLRRLLFAPNSPALAATTKMLVNQALRQWLSQHITVQAVEVTGGEPPQEETVLIRIDYVLIETRSAERIEVRVS